MKSSRISRTTGAASGSRSPPTLHTPTLTCDLCEWPMALPDHLRGQKVILGLLVCTACIEDQLESAA